MVNTQDIYVWLLECLHEKLHCGQKMSSKIAKQGVEMMKLRIDRKNVNPKFTFTFLLMYFFVIVPILNFSSRDLVVTILLKYCTSQTC